MVTNVLSFLCLHSKYIAKFVASNEIIAEMNRKTSTMKLLEKKVFLGKFVSIISCLSFKSKNSFLCVYWRITSLGFSVQLVVLSQS